MRRGSPGLGAKVAVADLNLRTYEEFEAEAKGSYCPLHAVSRAVRS
jgi:hypothetical protein